MKDFAQFLTDLGNLHDCTVTLFEWSPGQRSAAFEIADLYWNFEGLPEYRGPLKGGIILEGIRQLTIDLDFEDRALRIDDFMVEKKELLDAETALITFWGGGKIRATYQRAIFPDI